MPSFIHFGLDEHIVDDFSHRICHALAIKLYHQHIGDGWKLEAFCPRYKREYPSHILVSRPSPVVDGREYIDVKGIYRDKNTVFERRGAEKGYLSQTTEGDIEWLQNREKLSDLDERDFQHAREPFAKIERLLPAIDSRRPLEIEKDETHVNSVLPDEEDPLSFELMT